ncbi:MAG TPA: chromate transporter [Candidatus Dormibacteraeota bacterium]|nr:chromate transporter [Candidatus Dormibacteraeota bacterium]
MAQQSQGIMQKMEYYFVTKAPFQIPKGAKDWIVKYAPWINIVILVLLAPAILVALGLGAAVLPFSGLGGATAAAGLGAALIALIVQVVLMIAALPGLFARKMSGWNLVFYSDIVNLVYSIMNGQIVSGLVSAVIGLYILFQIRSYYKQ